MNSEKKVIVVDDDANLASMIEEALSYEGYEVIIADNGYSALSLIRQEQPGLILLDLILPRLDGLKLCKKLKEDMKTRSIPVLVISGQTRRDFIIELLKMGIKNFLAKPFNVKDLIKRVEQLYVAEPASGELTHLKVKYSPGADMLNIKLSGSLSFEDIPVLIKNIEQRLLDRAGKVILNVMDLDALADEEIKILEEIKNYFEPRNIQIRISAGDARSQRSGLLIKSPLKENTLVF